MWVAWRPQPRLSMVVIAPNMVLDDVDKDIQFLGYLG
jgi:hypothetical protein